MSANHLQLAYLPYISMASTDEIQIGRVKIWNYSRKADDYITDTEIYQQIKKIINLNKERKDFIKNIGIISIGNIDFRIFTETELNEIQEACTILFLSVLSSQINLKHANSGHYMRTSENFRCVIQNFVVGDKFIAEIEGAIIRINDMNLISEITIYKPRYVHLNKFDFRYDAKLLENMLVLKNRRKLLFNRIIRATEVFRQSYHNSEDVNLPLRMLFQICSFETLLSLGFKQQRRMFKDKVEFYCNVSGDIRYRHSYKINGRKMQDIKRTIKGKWAESFYQSRNSIVHGKILKSNDIKFRNNQFHFNLAIMFFIVIIKKLINDGLNSTIFHVDINWDKKAKTFDIEDLTRYFK